MDEKDTNLLEVISSFGFSFAIGQVILPFLLGGVSLPVYLACSGIFELVFCPITYLGIKKAMEREKKATDKRLRCVEQSFMMALEDAEEKDQTIGKTTTNFHRLIGRMLTENDLELDDQSQIYLEDLLFLINANYYDDFRNYLRNVHREELLDKVLERVAGYLQANNTMSLNDEDIAQIIDSCIFFSENLRKEIMQEYKKSEVDFNGMVTHSIVNKNVDLLDNVAYLEEKRKETTPGSSFDVNSMDSYYAVVEGLAAKDTYLQQFGNVHNIEWDMEALKAIVSTIDKRFRRKLISQIDDYSNLNLTCSFVYNIMCYAVLNGKAQISYPEMLAVFKDWDFLPFQLKFEVIDAIIEELNLKQEYHPFQKKKKSNKKVYQKDKIISFPGSNQIS